MIRTSTKYYLFFFFFFNLVFGLLSFIFPYDMAAFEIDFDGETSFYETLDEDKTPGVLNFSFVHGDYSAMMRMIAVFRLSLSLGFLSILIKPKGKWAIMLMAIFSNLGLLIIAAIESKGDGFTGSGSDFALIFHTLTLILLMYTFKLLIDEELLDGFPDNSFLRGN